MGKGGGGQDLEGGGEQSESAAQKGRKPLGRTKIVDARGVGESCSAKYKRGGEKRQTNTMETEEKDKEEQKSD